VWHILRESAESRHLTNIWQSAATHFVAAVKDDRTRLLLREYCDDVEQWANCVISYDTPQFNNNNISSKQKRILPVEASC